MFPCWRVWSHPQASEQLVVCSTGHNFIVQASTLQTLGNEAMCMWQCVREKRNCLPLGLQLLLQTRTKHGCTPSSLCSLVCENTCYQNMAMRLSEFLLWNHDHVPMHLGSRLVKTFRLPQTWCHSARGMVALWFCGSNASKHIYWSQPYQISRKMVFDCNPFHLPGLWPSEKIMHI